MSSKLAWSTEEVLGQLRLHRETLYRQTKTKEKRKENPRLKTCTYVISAFWRLRQKDNRISGQSRLCSELFGLKSFDVGGPSLLWVGIVLGW